MILYSQKNQTPFQIDKEYEGTVSNFTWYITESGYARTHLTSKRGLFLHELIMGKAIQGFEWDHLDRNKLNNCKENLRLVTRTVNSQNKGPTTKNISGVPGVWWYERKQRWIAYIHLHYQKITLGSFIAYTDAVNARKAAEFKYWMSDVT